MFEFRQGGYLVAETKFFQAASCTDVTVRLQAHSVPTISRAPPNGAGGDCPSIGVNHGTAVEKLVAPLMELRLTTDVRALAAETGALS